MEKKFNLEDFKRRHGLYPYHDKNYDVVRGLDGRLYRIKKINTIKNE